MRIERLKKTTKHQRLTVVDIEEVNQLVINSYEGKIIISQKTVHSISVKNLNAAWKSVLNNNKLLDNE